MSVPLGAFQVLHTFEPSNLLFPSDPPAVGAPDPPAGRGRRSPKGDTGSVTRRRPNWGHAFLDMSPLVGSTPTTLGLQVPPQKVFGNSKRPF